MSPAVFLSKQAVAESTPVSVHSNWGSDTEDDAGMNTQVPLTRTAAASSNWFQAQAIMNVDKEVPRVSQTIIAPDNDHIVCALDPYASSIAYVGLRMSVAIMVRPSTVVPQSPRAQGTEKPLALPNHEVRTDTSKTADVSQINKC